MQLTRLRLAGFKTFVEPTEFLIEPGLTGVVGPNGCGKSNLVEALRWVMGESSFKNMRASGMEDVIFSGSAERPGRTMAEVALTLDNSDRKAPAAFNDADMLEVTRRIERDEGSTYRVNGKEVRARDVQLLFADAATGARSPALVRQGQISEIISAKPQSRRRILEDAAGIGGLHGRRHEAELRLRGAEDNLARLDDVLGEIERQMEGLQRQSRQAARYRSLAADIRRAEAVVALIAHRDALAQQRSAEADLAQAADRVAERTGAQAAAARDQAVAAHAMPALRQAEAEAAAALVRIRRGLDELEAEARRSRERTTELSRRVVELKADIVRQDALAADAGQSLARLAEEQAMLAALAADGGEQDRSARAILEALDDALARAETDHAARQGALAEIAARRAAIERTLAEARARAARNAAEKERVERSLAELDARAGGEDLDDRRRSAAEAERAAAAADAAVATTRTALADARDGENRARAPLAEAERSAQRLDAEIATLRKLFAPAPGSGSTPVLDEISADAGWEAALAAALGDDLDAPADTAAPAHWRELDPLPEAPLPAGAEPLAGHVRTPPVLARRIARIGVVARSEGAALQARLSPGQRLVSREGDLWRWDGFVSGAEAPSPAARRLAERNRLAGLEERASQARELVLAARAGFEAANGAVREAAAAEAEAIDRQRQARRQLDAARIALAAAERAAAEVATRRSALAEAVERLSQQIGEAQQSAQAQERAVAALPDAIEAERAVLEARALLGERRAAASDARAQVQTLAREAELRQRRHDAIGQELDAWRRRGDQAEATAADARARLEAVEREAAALAEAPDRYLVDRRRLLGEIEAADLARKAAADALAAGEGALAAADRAARSTLDELAAAREARASAEARSEAAALRTIEVERQIADGLQSDIAGLAKLAGLSAGAALPDHAAVENRLAHLRAERERLGAVNLRAEDELAEIRAKREGLVAERDDLDEAIRRLRQAIAALNREGRERLLAAFEIVHGHFQRLFGVLFGGGTAELSLVDADDPLEAGLEIFARPPGKKPQVMTLLSGGEQALTATALIFAVFLTNPSPICVLDEVDAPLDDANVERYCDLLDEMARTTRTRFVLITHNPITMARMDRLFGVTMAERGVSQMVSVDLSTAERIREAV